MSVFEVLRHQWRRRWRSATWGRHLVGTVFLVLVATHFGLLFVGLGWFYPEVVAEVAPDRTPLRLLNAHLLYGAVGLVVGRFFLQRSSGSTAEAYLSLPIRTPQLVRLLQVTSALSLFNVLPLVLLAVLWRSTVWPAVSPAGAASWAVGVLLTVALTQFANSLLRVVWDRNAGFVLGGAAVLVLIEGAGYAVGRTGLRAASAWLFGGLTAGATLPLVVLGVGTVGMAWAVHRALRGQLYDVMEKERTALGSEVGVLSRWRSGENRVAALILVELKLIFRNKRPRQVMSAAGLIIISAFVFIATIQELPSFDVVLFSFILGGYLGLMHSQYGFAWHGHHFDGVLIRTTTPRKLVYAQCAVFAGLVVGPFVLLGPVVAFLHPDLLGPIGAFLLYNLGVTAPLLIGMGTWARDAIALRESSFFTHQGTSAYHIVLVLLLMGLPLGMAAWLGLSYALLIAAGLGILGIATAPLWTRWIGDLLRRQRHAMAAGFRETN